MGLAKTVLGYTFAAMTLMVGVIFAVIFGFAICMWVGFLYRNYCDHYNKSKTTNMEMKRYGFGYGYGNSESEHDNTKVTHLLFTKISTIEAQLRESNHDSQAKEERERFSGLKSPKCKICLKEFSDTEKTRPWIVVMPHCHHVWHRECSYERFTSNIDACPCCRRTFRVEDLKEVLIDVKASD